MPLPFFSPFCITRIVIASRSCHFSREQPPLSLLARQSSDFIGTTRGECCEARRTGDCRANEFEVLPFYIFPPVSGALRPIFHYLIFRSALSLALSHGTVPPQVQSFFPSCDFFFRRVSFYHCRDLASSRLFSEPKIAPSCDRLDQCARSHIRVQRPYEFVWHNDKSN